MDTEQTSAMSSSGAESMNDQAALSYCLDEGEKLLVTKCLTGNQNAWDEFFEGHYGTISSVVSWKKWRFIAHEVEDITQEIVLEIIKSLKTFQFKSNLNTFVYRIAINTCIAHIRKKTAGKRKLQTNEVAVDHIESGTSEDYARICINPGKNQEELLLEEETFSLLKKALFKLEERCKELIEKRYFLDASFQEIALATGIKPNTLIVQLKRCLARVMRLMNEEK
jgi:RNA polymerase sigma factor (sigma-70 family)